MDNDGAILLIVVAEDAYRRVVDIELLESVPVGWIEGDFCQNRMRGRQPKAIAATRSNVAISHWSASPSEVTMGIDIGECSSPTTASVLAHVIWRDHKPSRPVNSRTIDKTISLTCFH